MKRVEVALKPRSRLAVSIVGLLGVGIAAALATGCGLSAQGTGPGAEGVGEKDATSVDDSGAFGHEASIDAELAESGDDDGASLDGTGADGASPDAATGLDGAGDGGEGASADGGDATIDGAGNPDGAGPADSASDADAGAVPDSGPVEAGPADAGPVDAAADRFDAASFDAGAEGGDASRDGSSACDLNGTWASRLTIDVSWSPQGLTGIILAPGTGQIRQWIKGVRVQNGTATTDSTVVCGIELPDFQGTAIIGSENYGVRFPNSLFDNAYLPTFTVSAALSGLTPGSTYSTTTTAALLGLTMAHPTTDPWPSTITTAVDVDQDGKPAVTIDAAQGSSYSDIPTGIPAPFQPVVRANKLYVAIRQVTVVTATVADCDHMTGTVSIPTIQSKAAIDSHIVGCALTAGGDCSSTQASFVDNTQPVFTPSGTTDFHSVRLATGATCGDVRAALP